jgi:hypothetical protein
MTCWSVIKKTTDKWEPEWLSLLSCVSRMNKPIIKKSRLHPQWISGFIDAEGSFGLYFIKNSTLRFGWQIRPSFRIRLHKKDLALLQEIQNYFSCLGEELGQQFSGQVRASGDSVVFRVYSSAEIVNVIFPHFDKYPLVTEKLADYLLFSEAVKLIYNKEHLNLAGLEKVINIKASLNWGLSDQFKAVFPKSIPVSRPVVENKIIPHGMWMAGFTAGEGCFLVSEYKSNAKLGITPKLTFSVTQHSRDEELLFNFITYLGCGRYAKRSSGDAGDFLCTKFPEIVGKIIPFFNEYPILGSKLKDFEDWKKVAELMSIKAHLTSDGLDQIRKIKRGMNRGRLAD